MISCNHIWLLVGKVVILSVIATSGIHAQLSPGDLAEPHAHLEGLFNCTKCHTLGEKISDQKCLDCHILLNDRIEAGLGFHASSTVKGKSCIECHSDHHGRDFELVRFDENTFNHNLTGYPLEGAHARQDCATCHKDEYISDPEIREKDYTFLGLDTECLSCHEDYHQGTLSTNCMDCHDSEAFSPAFNFEHAQTDFPLFGAHRNVDCAACHPMELIGGQNIQKFTGIEFSNCTSCHEDIHNARLGSNCKACHTEQSFNQLRSNNTFDHTQTDFPLRGKHQNISCTDCHTTDSPVENVFLDYQNADHSNCTACHEDVHDNKFGQDCRSCHDENSFTMTDTPDDFNHGLTAFTLEGKHIEVDCRDCHSQSLTEPLPHQNCADCHTDYHEQEFAENGISPDCAECHTVWGFEQSTFSFEDHLETDFPLSGAHLATPCFACHLPDAEEKWQFLDLGTDCIDCHENIHTGYLEEKYYVEVSCTYCHSTDAWNDIAFEHDSTNFPLEGAHLEVSCSSCHFDQEPNDQIQEQTFAGLSGACESCHEDPHATQFDIEGTTDCKRCHGPEIWSPSQFDHDSTDFPLDGAHVGLECIACHEEENINSISYINYQIEKFECIDCHK